MKEDRNVKAVAFYLPQFHEIPENNRWWGDGFTEWTNVKKAKPLFLDHYQPHVPLDGYYDLMKDRGILRKQAELAKDFGVYGFCFYYYWFSGKKLLEGPLLALLADKDNKIPFCICWANENWSRRWDGLESEVLISQKHNPEDDTAFIDEISEILKDKRYIRIDGRPILAIYRSELFPDIKQSVASWRKRAREVGVGELYLVRIESVQTNCDPTLVGFDAAIEFAPDWNSSGGLINQDKINYSEIVDEIIFNKERPYIYDYDKTLSNILSKRPKYKLFRGVFPSWDNTPRRGEDGTVFLGSSPDKFRYFVKRQVEYTSKNYEGDERLIFVNAWNEWAEGCHLEPDKKYGHEYLIALRDGLCDAITEEEKKVYIETLEKVNQINSNNIKKYISEKNDLSKVLSGAICENETLTQAIAKITEEKNSIIYSKGWKMLEYLRSIRYPLNFIHRTFRIFVKFMKIALPAPIYNFIRNIYIYIREKRYDLRVRHGLKKVIQGEDPLITVVIPIYDRVADLVEAIESVLHQSFQDFELLLITDGSPKETLEIVRKYSKNPKIRTFEYPANSGNSVRGRNKGILEARGKYLAFLDSDDVSLKDRLRDTVATFEKTGADVVYGGYEFSVSGERDIPGINDGQKVLPQKFTLDELKKANYLFNSATAVRTDFVKKVGGLKNSMRYCEDYELWLRMMDQGARFEPLNKVVIKYRIHGGNLELKFKNEEKKWQELSLKEYKTIPTLPKKIAYIIPGTGIGGGIAVACEHANRLAGRGYDLTFVIDPVYEDSRDLSWFPNQNIPLVDINKASSEYDIAIATGWNTAHTLDVIKAKRKIYFVQSDERRFTNDKLVKNKIEKTYQMNYEFMTEAKWIKKWLKKEFKKESFLVPNAVNRDIFYEDEPLATIGKKLRVLLEGPIDIPFKGLEDSFNVVSNLDCEVWCVSSLGKPKPGWRLDRFFEKVPQEEMRKIYSSCDVLLKLSRVEGFFGPPLEMMACGGTAVVGDVTGYDEYILDGKNALVVKLGDIEGAKKAIQRLIDDKKLLEKLKKGGKETAEQMNWEKSIDLLEKIVKK